MATLTKWQEAIFQDGLDSGLWLAALEKAIALHIEAFGFGQTSVAYHYYGNFADRLYGHIIDDGYYLNWITGPFVMRLLTGSDADLTHIDDLNLKDLHENLTVYTNQSKIATAGTSCATHDNGRAGSKGKMNETLMSCHEYSILGYDPDKKQVTLRNPYGEGAMFNMSTEWPFGEIDDEDDGVFSVSLREFKELFDSIISSKS